MKINSNKLKSLFLLSLVGSASTNEDKTNNQTEINLNSLPEIATNFTKRENETDPTLIFGGYPISIPRNVLDDKGKDNCTVAFAITIVKGSDDCLLVEGSTKLITSASCCKKEDVDPESDCGSFYVFNPENDITVGRVDTSYFEDAYQGFSGPDYLYITSPSLGNENKVKPIPYVMGKEDSYPVMGLGSVVQGGEVCAFGSFSGYLCGKLVETGLSIESSREGINFTGVNKVDVGEGHGFDSERDLGAPVYVTNTIGERTTAQALGYISVIDNSDLNHKLFYYTPISVFFDYLSNEQGCSLELITYNETNAQQYDNLLAQMEIPTKK